MHNKYMCVLSLFKVVCFSKTCKLEQNNTRKVDSFVHYNHDNCKFTASESVESCTVFGYYVQCNTNFASPNCNMLSY